MPRIPWGARTLLQQIAEVRPQMTYIEGDLDGLDVNRSLTFDTDTGPWLYEVLRVAPDPRIRMMHLDDDGTLTVYFQNTIDADGQDSFYIGEAALLVESDAKAQAAPSKRRKRTTSTTTDS